MRSLFFPFLLCLTVYFAACGSDDDTASENEVLGTWQAIFFESETEAMTDFNGMTTNSTSEIVSSNLNYQVTFGATSFATEGSYDLTTTTTVPPSPPFTINSSLSNIEGSGSYSINGNQMAVSGAFFVVEINGSPIDTENEEQLVTFEINADGELVFTQNQEFITNQSWANSTTIIRSTSIWRRI